jgi:hypothetical protein
MQFRHNGITVNERLKHCSPSPNREDHSIIVPDIDYLIPLSLHGVCFPTRTPSKQEAAMYKIEGEYLELTAETPSWDPNSMMFSQLESRLVDQYGELVDRPVGHPRQLFMMTTDDHLHDPFRQLRISATTTKRPGAWNSEFLAHNWGIGIETAERTLRATTQRGVRAFDGNTVGVERQFPTGDRHLRYITLFSTITSTRGAAAARYMRRTSAGVGTF